MSDQHERPADQGGRDSSGSKAGSIASGHFELEIEILDDPTAISSAAKAHPGQVVSLTAEAITAAAERRSWLPQSRGPRSEKLGTSLLMCEAPKFHENDPADGCDRVIAMRRRTGRELLIGDHSEILTPPAFRDSAVGSSPAGVVRARTLTTGGIRLPLEGFPPIPADSDFIGTHSMVEMFTDGSPYQTARMAPRFLLHLDPPTSTSDEDWRPLTAAFNTSLVALSPDGRTAAAVEFRTSGESHSPYALVLINTSTGETETVAELPSEPTYEFGSLSFSPNARYLMVSAPRPATTLVIDLKRRAVTQALEHWEAAAFCPGGMWVVTRLDMSAVRVSRFDATAGALTPKLEIREESSDTVLMLSGLSTDVSGRRVAGITTIGVSPESRYTNGWSWRPFVMDPEDGWAELALKPQMASGHDREIISVAWADPWAARDYPTLSKGFATPKPIGQVREVPDYIVNRWSEEWYDASQFALFAAGGPTGPGLPQVLQAILVLLAGVAVADETTGRELAEHLAGLFEAGYSAGSQPSSLWREAPTLARRVANGEPVATVYPAGRSGGNDS